MKTMIMALAMAMVAFAAQAQPISIGTNPQGSLTYTSGSVLADVVGDALGESFTVVPLGGPTALVPAMIDGEFQFSFANVTAIADAMEGRGAFDGRPQPDVRLVAALYPLRLGVIVRDDSGINSVEDLRGKRIASEYSSQRNLSFYQSTILAMAGMNYDDVTPVPVQSGAQAVDDLIDGQLDGTIFSVGSGIVAKADASIGVRFLSLPDNAEAAKVLGENHGGAKVALLPDGTTSGIRGDTNIIAAPMVLVTSADADDETIRKVVAAVADNLPKLAEGQSNFSQMTREGMADSSLPVPYHDAARVWFEENGLWK
ncbi:MAG: TAXI family TRAP transporter solute-binding subunit [Pseudorhodobacter sp.]